MLKTLVLSDSRPSVTLLPLHIVDLGDIGDDVRCQRTVRQNVVLLSDASYHSTHYLLALLGTVFDAEFGGTVRKHVTITLLSEFLGCV